MALGKVVSRIVETLAYGVAASILVFGSLYGLARIAESSAPAAPPAVEPAAATPAAAVPMAPAPPAPAPRNVLRAAGKTYILPEVPQDQADLNVYYALRNNCYASARNNSGGEFPGLQQAACQRYSDYARAHGWDAGALPGYAAPPPRESGEQLTVIGQAEPVDGGQCALLYQQELEVEAALRAGYREPQGNWLRAQQRDLQERLWQLHCPRR
jgi:hypothetical protein